MKTSFFAVVAGVSAVLAAPRPGYRVDPQEVEYITAGCPKHTTHYPASHYDQVRAVEDYSNLLFVQKNPAAGLSKYVAKNLINHEPQVSGNGRSLAINLLTAEEPLATITLLRQYVGAGPDDVVYGTVNIKSIINPPGGAPSIDFDVVNYFRMIGTCIVENWDVSQNVGASNTTNPIAFYPKK